MAESQTIRMPKQLVAACDDVSRDFGCPSEVIQRRALLNGLMVTYSSHLSPEWKAQLVQLKALYKSLEQSYRGGLQELLDLTTEESDAG